MSDIKFFATPGEFRSWLDDHHDSTSELHVGYHKKGTGRPSMTWEQSVDEALCYGWIDGVRRRVDDDSYTIRFTPRKPGSIWSARNLERVAMLQESGRMQPAGIRVFEERDRRREAQYSYENDHSPLAPEYQQRLEGNPEAWEFFRNEAAWYQRAATHWVMSAKRVTTRESRLETLITDSEQRLRVKPLSRDRR